MGACAKAWPRHSSPNARTTCRCRFFQATRNISIYRKIPIRRLLWWGPATGVAPLSSVLAGTPGHRRKGKNWLVFGAQHVNCDFAYEEDFDTFMKEGILTRLDCAWSRDQVHKVYVPTQAG